MDPVARSAWWIALLLAGCTSHSGAPSESEAESSVAGVVVTQAIEPLPGADVRLEPQGLEATTDLFGRFRFDALEPGTYRIAASAPGHLAATVTVAVEEGQTVRPRVVLAAEPAEVVRHDTHEFQGFVPAWLGPADAAARPAKSTVGARCTCVFEVPAPDGLAGVTVEAVWQDSVQRQDGPTSFTWNVTMERSVQGSGPSPVHAHVLASHMPLNGTTITVSVLPDETWPAHDQAYQLFLTTWQGEEPPATWSRVRGDP